MFRSSCISLRRFSTIRTLKFPENSVYFGNLPKDVRVKELEGLALPYGRLQKVTITGNFANIEFFDESDAESFHSHLQRGQIRFRKQHLTQQPLYLVETKHIQAEEEPQQPQAGSSTGIQEAAPSTKLTVVYLGNLPYDITLGELRKMSEQYGPLKRITIPAHPERDAPAGFANVEFESSTDAEKFHSSMTNNSVSVRGRDIFSHLVNSHLEHAIPRQSATGSVYISNFPPGFQVTIRHIEDLISPFNKSANTKIQHTHNRVYAHIEFASTAHAMEVVEGLRSLPPPDTHKKISQLDPTRLEISYSFKHNSGRLDRQPSSSLYFRGAPSDIHVYERIQKWLDAKQVRLLKFLDPVGDRTTVAGHIHCYKERTATEIYESCKDDLLVEYANHRDRPDEYQKQKQINRASRRPQTLKHRSLT